MAGLGRILGRVRGLSPNNSPENREDEQFHITPTGEQLIAEGLPERAEIVRLGDSWQVMSNAFAPLIAVPTTAGALTLWNGEPGNGKVYIIDSVAITKVIIDVTINGIFTLWMQCIKSPMAAPIDVGFAKVSLSGKTNYGGRARSVATSVTLANNWINYGNTPVGATAIAGSAWLQLDYSPHNKCIIVPGAACTIHVSENNTLAGEFRATMRWHEIQLPRN